MFRPNLSCTVVRSSGHTDVYGMPQPGVRYTERFAIVKLNVASAKTAVRADTSATRGNAQELETSAVFLMQTDTVVDMDDLVEFSGMQFRVLSKFPRHNVRGVLDHYEIGLAYWSKA